MTRKIFIPAVLEQSPQAPLATCRWPTTTSKGRCCPSHRRLSTRTGIVARSQADIRDRLALAYYKQNARAEAIAQWKQALAVLQQQVSKGPRAGKLLDRFCTYMRSLAQPAGSSRSQARSRRPSPRLSPPQRQLSFKRSVAQRLPRKRAEPAAATVWLLDLASVAPDPGAVLADIVEAPWIPVAQRAPIHQRCWI